MNSSSIDNGYWMYLGSCEPPTSPRILTRTEKGQALTHLEMDVNLASFLHTLVTSSVGDPFADTEHSEENDVFYERRKPTREEEKEGLFATFSYAKVVHSGSDGEEVLVEYDPIKIKIQHTTDEIRYKLSNELIPGTLDIAEDFHVTGSIFTHQDIKAEGNAEISGTTATDNLQVQSSGKIMGDLYINGNLYVNGVMFGNLSRQEYHPTEDSLVDYPYPYDRQVGPPTPRGGGLRSTKPEDSNSPKFYTQEEVDQMLQSLREELLSEIHGKTEK